MHDLPGPQPDHPNRLALHDIFAGPEGLRSGWGLLLFVLLWQLSRSALYPLVHSFLPPAGTRGQGMDPVHILALEATGLFCVVGVTWVLARIEGRHWLEYGLVDPLRLRHFAAGAGWGVVLLSALIAGLRAGGALVFDGRQLFGYAVWKYAALWMCAFLLVGFFEELLFRGYVQFTIARAVRGICARLGMRHRAVMGFWTAALLTSFYFGFGHGANPGESPIGLASAGLIGLVFCFSIWRTGSLWWAIGFHAAWDWMESFLFGVGDSGSVIQGRLLGTHPSGAPPISGGTTGPEGSVLIFPAIAALALIVAFTLRRTSAMGPAKPYPSGVVPLATENSLH